jgi:ppGpp synthetase/RelA/SpoT-type nucleotidyltranferase
MATEQLVLNKVEFFRQYRFSSDDFDRSGLDWSFLEQLCGLHAANLQELQTTAEYILQRLRQVPAVHSLKMRIKHPEHLIAKIIRKKLDDPAREITIETYDTAITDLIGIKALHLLKDQWRPIHEFVTNNWDLLEEPIAYIRDGDPEYLTRAFKDCGCTVKEHNFGYRSIHYLLKSQPARRVQIAELQVRTLFEEGWSEIDHQVRYPRMTDNPRLTEFLTIFNRLAGSADEMGTFIQALSTYLSEQAEKLARKESELEAKEKELKKTISKLRITEKEKSELETQVEQLHQTSRSTTLPFLSSTEIPNLFVGDTKSSQYFTLTGSTNTAWSPGIVTSGLQTKSCSKCGKIFADDSLLRTNDKCPDCRMTK